MTSQESCVSAFRHNNDQMANRSPESRNDLTPAEHAVAQRLADDTRTLYSKPGKDPVQWVDNFDKAQKDIKAQIAGIQDKSRIDGILADANKILSKDDEKLLQGDNGLIAGKFARGSKTWGTTAMQPLDCDPSLGPKFQIIDRANREREFKLLETKAK